MKENDIRPPALFAQYLELSRQDNERFFSDHSAFVAVPCPACGSQDVVPAFDKQGFTYYECADCQSLYMSPRPTDAHLNAFMAQAQSVKFWSTDFYSQTAEARRRWIFQPRAQLVAELAERHQLAANATYVDIGAGYGIMLEEVARLGVFDEVSGIEPSPDLAADCRAKGFSILEQMLEAEQSNPINADFMTAFEVLEHVNDPLGFMAAVKSSLRPGGLALLTTLTVTGFDIQTLWSASNAISPPHHINLLSVAGYRKLVERAGLELVELTTPGALDLDIVRNAILADSGVTSNRFVKFLAVDATTEQRAAFQTFLVDNTLSSHIRLVVRRKA